MSEVTQFYGLKYFYPGLYTHDEAVQQKELMDRDLWPLVLDLCYAAGLDNLYITRVAPGGKRVVLTDKHGYPVMEPSVTSSGYNVHNWYQQLKRRGRSRYSIESKNRTYIMKAMRPFIEPMLLQVNSSRNGMLLRTAQSVNQHLNNETNNAMYISNQSLSAEQAYAALKLIFDENYTKLQVDALTLNRLETLYKELGEKFTNKKTYAERLKDMFDHPKWVVVMHEFHGMKFFSIGSVLLTPTAMTTSQYKMGFEMPLTLYRSLDGFYAKHPEHEGSLKAALMFCKVFREKLPEQKSHDTEGFIPCGDAVYEDIGGIAFCASYTINIVSPQYLLLQK